MTKEQKLNGSPITIFLSDDTNKENQGLNGEPTPVSGNTRPRDKKKKRKQVINYAYVDTLQMGKAFPMYMHTPMAFLSEVFNSMEQQTQPPQSLFPTDIGSNSVFNTENYSSIAALQEKA